MNINFKKELIIILLLCLLASAHSFAQGVSQLKELYVSYNKETKRLTLEWIVDLNNHNIKEFKITFESVDSNFDASVYNFSISKNNFKITKKEISEDKINYLITRSITLLDGWYNVSLYCIDGMSIQSKPAEFELIISSSDNENNISFIEIPNKIGIVFQDYKAFVKAESKSKKAIKYKKMGVNQQYSLDENTGELHFIPTQSGIMKFKIVAYLVDDITVSNIIYFSIKILECPNPTVLKFNFTYSSAVKDKRGVMTFIQKNSLDNRKPIYKTFDIDSNGNVDCTLDKGFYYLYVTLNQSYIDSTKYQGSLVDWYMDSVTNDNFITVRCYDTLDINMELGKYLDMKYYNLTGVVKFDDGIPIVNQEVFAIYKYYDVITSKYIEMKKSARTDFEGKYKLNLLQDFEYLIAASAIDIDPKYGVKFWNNANFAENATKITLTNDMDSINFVFENNNNNPQKSIIGKVKNINNEGIGGIKVTAWIMGYFGESNSTLLFEKFSTYTDMNGNFNLKNLPDAKYVVQIMINKIDFYPGYIGKNGTYQNYWENAQVFNIPNYNNTKAEVNLKNLIDTTGTAVIKGVIKSKGGGIQNDEINERLENVSVYLLNSMNKVFKFELTNADGEFVLQNVPTGKYEILFDKIGYIGLSKNLTFDSISTLEYWLVPDLFISAISDKNNNDHPNFNIYPNPAKDFLNVVNYDNQNYNFEIYDIVGNKIENYKNNKINGNNQTTIDVTNIPQGLYILKIIDNSYTYILKFSIIK